MSEFDLIGRYFTWNNTPQDVVTAVGDDAAVLDVPENNQIVTSIDTLISGVHFPENTSAKAIGHKALAVNLSDLAAMGAKPKWFTLALTLPDVDIQWLEDFSSSLKSLANKYGVYLVGGDTTRGPLTISIQVIGVVENDHSLLRSGATVGDSIYVTGTLGDAAAGLRSIQHHQDLGSKANKSFCEHQLNFPEPRIIESNTIRQFASSCIDVSDGLLQDLSHILKASEVGAELDISSLPISTALSDQTTCLDSHINNNKMLEYVLSGGDDYELLFTIPQENEAAFLAAWGECSECVSVSKIGSINDQTQKIADQSGNELTSTGYNHFNVE